MKAKKVSDDASRRDSVFETLSDTSCTKRAADMSRDVHCTVTAFRCADFRHELNEKYR